MASVKKYEYVVPRSFRLRQELEFAEKGHSGDKAAANKPKDPHQGFVSFGLGDLDDTSYDTQLCNWNGTIIGPQNTPLGDRIYGVKLKCGPRYPDVPPQLAFVNKIAGLNGVNANGLVDYQQVTGRMWTRNTTMYEYLCRVREAMVVAAKTKQPSAEDQYPSNNL